MSFPDRQGHFVRTLGKAGEKDTEQEVLLLEHDVPHQPFSQAVLSFLPKMPWAITPEVMTTAHGIHVCFTCLPVLWCHIFVCVFMNADIRTWRSART